METKLRFLYALQQVDSQLDELDDFKGELPAIVNQLTEAVNSLTNKISELETEIKNNKKKSDGSDVEIISLTEKIEKYKKQQYEVKTNKQYDALTHEIENSEKKIEQLTNDIIILEGNIKNGKEDLEKLKEELKTAEQELEERQAELDVIIKENEEEELKVQHERQKLVARIAKQDLAIYSRIRNAKDGIAVVSVKRNACGGCYNSLPPQKIQELRQNTNMFTCERCGRILVSDTIVEGSKNLL